MSATVSAQPVTAGALIALALRKIGVGATGQTPQTQDLQDGLTDLNMMMAEWQAERLMIWHLADLAAVSTADPGYLVGPGQQFNTVRLNRIEAAYARLLNGSEVPGTPIGGEFAVQEFNVEFSSSDFPASAIGVLPNGIDFPLRVIESREEWSRVWLKQLATFPNAVFFDSGYPYGTLFVWPIPQPGRFEIHIVVKEVVQTFSDTTVALNMPAEYQSAIVWNLAVRMASAYGNEAGPTAKTMASAAKARIKTANLQLDEIEFPVATMPYRGQLDPWWAGLLGN